MQTISLVFLVRPKSHSAVCSFYPAERAALDYFLLPLSQLPKSPCCYSTGQCCLSLRTARARNRFPALVRLSVEPFFGISNFGQKRILVKNGRTLLFWAAAAPPLVHQSMLLYHCKVCLPSENCRYANYFSSLLGPPKIPFCRVQFLSSRTSHMRLTFCTNSANFPKIHAAIVQASAAHHCKLSGLGTVFLLSFVRP